MRNHCFFLNLKITFAKPFDIMNVFCVIPFYNGDDFIKPCIDSLMQSEHPLTHIFIVDNSTVTTCVSEVANRFPNVSVIRTKPSIGFGRASNIGARFALISGADVVLILNQDTKVQPETIGRLLGPFSSGDDKIAIALPLVCEYEDINIINVRFIEMYISPIHALISDLLNAKKKQDFYEVNHAISGACIAVKSKFIRQLGLFDPLISMYGEDVDMFVRYRGYGARAVIVPQAKIAHKHSHLIAKGRSFVKVKSQIHRHTPYSIWNDPIDKKSLRIVKIFIFLLRSYAGAIFKRQWQLVMTFFVNDLTLIPRLFMVSKHRNISKLIKDVEIQVQTDML